MWRQGRGRSSEAVCRAQPSVGSASGQQLQVADSLVRLSQDGQQNGWGGQAERLERYQEAHLIQRPDAQRHLLEQAYVEYQRQKHQQQLQEAYVEYQRQKRLEQYHHEIETNQRSQEQQSHPLPEQQNQHASVMYSAGWNKSRSEIVDLLLRLTANMENGGRTAGRSGSSTRSVELAPTAHKASDVLQEPGTAPEALRDGSLARTCFARTATSQRSREVLRLAPRGHEASERVEKEEAGRWEDREQSRVQSSESTAHSAVSREQRAKPSGAEQKITEQNRAEQKRRDENRAARGFSCVRRREKARKFNDSHLGMPAFQTQPLRGQQHTATPQYHHLREAIHGHALRPGHTWQTRESVWPCTDGRCSDSTQRGAKHP